MATSSPLPPIRQKEIEAFLQANPLVRQWLTKWKPITRKLYAIDIIRFQQLSNTQIEQLLVRLENNQIKPREIRSLIETSLADLTNSVQARMDSAVRGFFKHHHGKLPDTTIKYLKIRDYRAYHKDELQALIGFLDKPLEQLFAIIATERIERRNCPPTKMASYRARLQQPSGPDSNQTRKLVSRRSQEIRIHLHRRPSKTTNQTLHRDK